MHPALLALSLAAPAWGQPPAHPLSSTSATNAAGTLAVTGIDAHALHTHGGDAAALYGASIRATYTGAAPLTLTVEEVAFLTSYSPPRPLEEISLWPTEPPPDPTKLGASVALQPGADVELGVGFSPVEAYQGSGEAFAFRITLRAGDEALIVVAETHVSRIEPIEDFAAPER